MHDWERVDAGIYHDLHYEWISELKRAMNRLLPEDYYALAKQHAGDFGPDVLALQSRSPDETASTGTTLAARPLPKSTFSAETPNQFYRRKQNSIAIRHVSGDRVVAMIEIVSPGNKSSNLALKSFVDKACELIQR